MDPNPDYDISDEAEYFFNFIPWGLRGVYPPPAYPRSNRALSSSRRLHGPAYFGA